MFKSEEKNREKELIEAIYKLVKELKKEKQDAPMPENIKSFIDFLKTPKGREFIRIFGLVISMSIIHSKEMTLNTRQILDGVWCDLKRM